MIALHRSALVPYVIVSLLAVLRTSVLTAESDASVDYKELLKCGSGSLLMFLTLHGKDVTLSALEKLPVQVQSDGISLQTLCEVAERFNVHAEVRRYQKHQVDSINLPAIAQLRSDPSSLTPWHFNVIYKTDSETVFMLNGTSGEKQSIARPRFAELWSGYVMAEKSSLFSTVRMHAKAAIILVSIAVSLALIFGWHVTKKPNAINQPPLRA